MPDPLSPSPVEAEKNEAGEHEHEWQPNGVVEVERVVVACCRAHDYAVVDVVSLAVCRCGEVQRTIVGSKGETGRRG